MYRHFDSRCFCLNHKKMPLTGGLFACEDPKVWTEVFSIYQDVIRAIGEKQKKLPALDQWYQNELPASVQSRAEKYLTHSELVKLMEWKLTRGKFRPRLQQMVTSNPSEIVEACTKKAFQLLPDVSAAITELSQLKAIGPATASEFPAFSNTVQIPPSTAYAVAPVKRPMEEDVEVKSPIEKKKRIQKKAVLAAGSPETAAFMADEALQSIPGLTPIQYTLKHYLLYLDKIRSCARKLNKEDAGAEWSPHRVELCLWAWAMAEKVRPALLENLGTGSVGKSSNGSGEKRSAKKIKTK